MYVCMYVCMYIRIQEYVDIFKGNTYSAYVYVCAGSGNDFPILVMDLGANSVQGSRRWKTSVSCLTSWFTPMLLQTPFGEAFIAEDFGSPERWQPHV